MARERYDVNGRTVLITGAARGIGAALAERMHGKGANVALVGLEPERMEQLAERLGDRAAWFEADVADPAAVQRAVAGAVERFGGIDVAVANAGLSFVGSIGSGPIEQIERTLSVNLLGVLYTDRAVIPQIVERRGYLLNIASLAAVLHGPLMGAYNISKSGVEAMSNSARAELAPTGARVGCAYFGFIDTDLVRAGQAHPVSKVMEGAMPNFLRKPAPLPVAIDAIERGIERRSARVWAPRFVGPAIVLRGILQPLTERGAARSEQLPEAIRLAHPDSGLVEGLDSKLGVAADAVDQPPA